MAINTSLLIAAPMLQDYLVDKSTGLPLAQGTVTLYQDNSRTTLKNWYYQTGTPGNYTYITLPNPLTLSAVGTIVDVNGNDTIPFFYPYSEADNETPQAYYITVDSSTGTRQFTRANFPFVPPNFLASGNPNFQNYIYNNVFWRNVGTLPSSSFTNTPLTLTVNGSTVSFVYTTIAPSQHDGMTMSDIQYFKNSTDATETITFKNFVANFADNILTNDVTPEFYLNLNCTGAGTETFKFIQIPIQLHVDNMSGYTQASVSIWAQNVGGGTNNQITLKLFQFLGTGVNSPSASTIRTITTTNTWEKYTASFTFPTSQSVTLSGAGDDAWYLQIGFPTSLTCNINIAKPSVYLSATQPTDELQNYDQVETIINSPRTGDIRTSLNAFVPFGWVEMNDGTIGNASSASTARANIDTWPLFNLLWNSFGQFDSGANSNAVCQMYNSAGVATNYGASAYADFTANNRLALTKQLGRVLLGTSPTGLNVTNTQQQQYTASNDGSGNLLITLGAANSYYYLGMPVSFGHSNGGTFPGNLNGTSIFYISTIVSSTQMYVSSSYANAVARTLIAYSSAGTGAQQLITNSLAGTITGEYAHTQLVTELAAHTHNIVTNNDTASNANITKQASSPGSFNTATSSTGSSTPFNVVQPSTYMNMFMKL